MANYDSSRTGQAHDNDENRLTTLENHPVFDSTIGNNFFWRGDQTWTNILNNDLTIGGTLTNINTEVTSGATSLLQITAKSGGSTNASVIGFHNPNNSSSSFGYYNTDIDTGMFRYRSDDSYWDITIGGSKKLSTAWGAANVTIGADGLDKAVIGYLPTSTTNGVVFGAHNTNLTGWAPVSLTGSIVNVRISEALKIQYENEQLHIYGNNQWLSPAHLQLMRPGTANYTDRAMIGVTNGNLHLDAYGGGYGLYLNFYNYTGTVYTSRLGTATANDYAESRNIPNAQNENPTLIPGMCVYDVGDGTMEQSTQRLQRGCKIISDTYGINLGATDNESQTPVAVSGRVLAYLYEDRSLANNYIGWPVCSGPNGTVSIMTEEEEKNYPSRIIGTISEIPTYEIWGKYNIQVNNRIWIYVK